jgi:hypothetical protein
MKKYMTAGLVTVALALGASACGGDDDKSGGGGSGGDVREKLAERINEDGSMDEAMVNCMVDAAMASFNEEDMASVLDGGNPSTEGEDKFFENALECGLGS